MREQSQQAAAQHDAGQRSDNGKFGGCLVGGCRGPRECSWIGSGKHFVRGGRPQRRCWLCWYEEASGDGGLGRLLAEQEDRAIFVVLGGWFDFPRCGCVQGSASCDTWALNEGVDTWVTRQTACRVCCYSDVVGGFVAFWAVLIQRGRRLVVKCRGERHSWTSEGRGAGKTASVHHIVTEDVEAAEACIYSSHGVCGFDYQQVLRRPGKARSDFCHLQVMHGRGQKLNGVSTTVTWRVDKR